MTIAAPCSSARLAEQLVDLALGADIDAARRLVDQQDGAVGIEAAGDQAFLLVAAAESLRIGVVRTGRADAEPAHKRADHVALARLAEQPVAAELGQAARW